MPHRNIRTGREFRFLRNKLLQRLLALITLLSDLLIRTDTMPYDHIITGQLDAVNYFSYTGSAQSVTVPLEVNSISVYMWGGGGYEGAGAYVEGTVYVYPGCTLNITVAGAGSWDSRISCKGSAHACYGEGGRSAIQISGEDMPVLIAEGGRGRSPPYSSSQSSPSYMDTVRQTVYTSQLRIISEACNGQHSKYYKPSACGRGGSRASQNGLVVIELEPPSTEGITETLSALSSSSAFSTVEPTMYPSPSPSSLSPTSILSYPSSSFSPRAPTMQPTDSPEDSFPLFIVVAPLLFASMTIVFFFVRCHSSFFQRINNGTPPGPVVAVSAVNRSLPVALATVVISTLGSTETSLVSHGDSSVYMMAELDDDLNICTAVPAAIFNQTIV